MRDLTIQKRDPLFPLFLLKERFDVSLKCCVQMGICTIYALWVKRFFSRGQVAMGSGTV